MKNRWKEILSRFKGKLIKTIKMLMLDLMIIPFHRKLVKFYWIGVIN